MKKEYKNLPRFYVWLLNRVADKEFDYGFFGDIEEYYNQVETEKGRLKAKAWFWIHLVRVFPSILADKIFWSIIMFKSYFKTSLRNLRKYKLYSFINIFGLAIGIASCITILLYIRFELSYDKFNSNAENIYRLSNSASTNSPFILGDKLPEQVPEIKNIVRFRLVSAFLAENEKKLFKVEDQYFYVNGVFLAEPSVFEIFTFPFTSGNPENALVNPNSMVITESTAKMIFGEKNPIGKEIIYEDGKQYFVTGVLKDVPENSHFTFNVLMPLIKAYEIDDQRSWTSWNYKTYLLLNEGVSVNFIEAKINSIFRKESGKEPFSGEFILQPLLAVHLNSHLRNELGQNSDIKYLYFYSAIALLILLIASINFMNLASANSLKRTKEVGVRKVLGALKRQLVKQFIGESVILAWLSFPLALFFVFLFLPYFNNISGTDLELSQIFVTEIMLGITGITLFIGFLSGGYPAFFASSFEPVKVFKGSKFHTSRKLTLRNILVLLQFALSVIFICSTFIINGQMNLIRKNKPGINEENIINVPLSKNMLDKYFIIKNELEMIPGITSVTASDFLPGKNRTLHQDIDWEGEPEDADDMVRMLYVDLDFVRTFDLEILDGRDFSKSSGTDRGQAYLLNESAARWLGWDDPVGKRIGRKGRLGRVVGVVRDFNFRSLHYEIEPVVIYLYPGRFGTYNPFQNISVKINNRNLSTALNSMKKVFDKHIQGFPFDYYFLDEQFDIVYKDELRTRKVFGAFSILAIILASMGLFGLSSFMVENRVREIGIRKVLGASVINILKIFTADFLKILIIANVLAIPVTYFVMNNWLNNFAYRITVSPFYFVVTGILTVTTAVVSVIARTIRAATAEPADSLRVE
ncbi:ABC transporter permease [candidate division KSB1 bacterium]